MRSSLALSLSFALVLSPLVSACGGDDDDDSTVDDTGDDPGDDVADDDGGSDACGDIEGRCIELSPADDGGAGGDQEALQTAFIDALPGDVILLHAGTYEFTLGLSLDVDQVTLRGEGEAETVLSFLGQIEGAQGILITADDFTAEDFAIEDTAGDGLKVEGGARIVFRGVRAEWTGEQAEDNGAYGIYPVQCTDILIEESIVRGASDAGIYVGQSERAVVRNSTVENNVAGIEIENTYDADVYGNTATANTGGILVFNLPDLQVESGGRTRVYDNDIFENNGENFAPAGNTVAQVPPGTGFVALSAHQVEVFGNTFTDNMSFQVGIISYYLTPFPLEDDTYDPYSDTLYFHDNVFVGGGDMPSGTLGAVVRGALDTNLGVDAPETIPDISFDHILNPEQVDEKTGELLPDFNVCLQDNGDADFVSLDAGAEVPFAGINLDATPFDCAHDPLPAVELDGVPL